MGQLSCTHWRPSLPNPPVPTMMSLRHHAGMVNRPSNRISKGGLARTPFPWEPCLAVDPIKSENPICTTIPERPQGGSQEISGAAIDPNHLCRHKRSGSDREGTECTRRIGWVTQPAESHSAGDPDSVGIRQRYGKIRLRESGRQGVDVSADLSEISDNWETQPSYLNIETC